LLDLSRWSKTCPGMRVIVRAPGIAAPRCDPGRVRDPRRLLLPGLHDQHAPRAAGVPPKPGTGRTPGVKTGSGLGRTPASGTCPRGTATSTGFGSSSSDRRGSCSPCPNDAPGRPARAAPRRAQDAALPTAPGHYSPSLAASPVPNARCSFAWPSTGPGHSPWPKRSLACGRSRFLPDSQYHRHAPLIRRSQRHRTPRRQPTLRAPPRPTFKIVREGSTALLNGRVWLGDARNLGSDAALGSGATPDVDVQLVARYLPGSAGILASWLPGELPWGRSDEVSAELSRRTADLLVCGGCGQWC